jgi:hypothetical protein
VDKPENHYSVVKTYILAILWEHTFEEQRQMIMDCINTISGEHCDTTDKLIHIQDVLSGSRNGMFCLSVESDLAAAIMINSKIIAEV